jgi:glycosyltransferase involved in cell wall biosynthesis
MSETVARHMEYPKAPDVEVLICTHDRVDLLARTLDSLNSSDLPDDFRLGILVVANACTDGTREFLEGYVASLDSDRDVKRRDQKLPLRWLEDPIPGKSHALNFALPQATGSVIAFVDDDHRVDSGYLKAICAASRQYPSADLFCGRILPDWDGTEPRWVHEHGPYRIYPLPVPRFDLGKEAMAVEPGTATPGGGNLAIRRGLFERVGEFQLDLGPHGHDLGGAEDIEWVRRALSGGAMLHYLPDMLQYHYVDSGRLTLWYVMRKAYERTASTTRLALDVNPGRWTPPFMIRKVLTYFVKAVTSLRQGRRRFYLTRLAAALGEIKGFQLQKRSKATTDKSTRSGKHGSS